ncbi:MAG: radical SAM protein [Clostridiales bacterium]|nr:radical SAM protein [Clostridiales bacterium]
MRVHFIEKGERFIAYFPDSKRFFNVNENGKNLISMLASGEADDAICLKLNINAETLLEYKDRIGAFPKTKSPDCLNLFGQAETPDKPAAEKKSPAAAAKRLSRLVVHLANACNLMCQYCYANGGVYLSREGVMTLETLKKTLDVFYERYDAISAIQMFGGEPLLNMPAVEYICEYVRDIDKKRGCTTMLGIVTNGILIDDKFCDLTVKYNISVTVSYDGDEKVNNLLRPFPDGSGSSLNILENIRRLRSVSSQPSVIEATYTQHHIDNGVSVLDAVKHIKDNFPDIHVHLVPAGGEKGCGFALREMTGFVDSVDEIFKRNKETPGANYAYSLVQRFVNGLASKAPGSQYICDAGVGTISVSSEGAVYPCFMFTDMEDLRLGTIFDDNLFEGENFKGVLRCMHEFNQKSDNEQCRKCYIDTLCNGCLGLNRMFTGSIYKLDERVCGMFRDMAEKVILNLAENIDKQESIKQSV